MQEKLLFDLVEELAGETTGAIVPILFNKKHVNEFLIARKMELTINQVRNILYKLSNFGLVSFIRKKDNKKGWYIYFWTLNTEKSLAMIDDSLSKKVKELEAELRRRETERFFVCKPCGIEVTEAVSLEHGFSCEECAEVYDLADNSKIIRETKAKITRTKNELKTINQELTSVREKLKKKRERAYKKADKIKAEKRAEERAERKKERDKLKKKEGKKVVKKVAKKKKKVVKKVKKKTLKKATKKKIPKKAVKKVKKKRK
jgi:transcription initiation factor TFIIE subunit alpha